MTRTFFLYFKSAVCAWLAFLGFGFYASVQAGSADTTEINRKIDVTRTSRKFPALVAYRNTSIQKAPAPVIAEISEKELGRPAITRCWLNLDEMWDYRTRKYDFNFKIGVDRYKDVAAKHRETWDWEEETSTTYYQYLQAFGTKSDEIMLTIRRYERDVLDGKLPITTEDWKTVFKTGLKHYKMLCPNIRYVEICNEPQLKMFMSATDEEYYQFYQLGYEAIEEVNQELGLEGRQRILAGGPVTTGNTLKLLASFFKRYSEDPSPRKKLDFVAWHEYTKPIDQTAFRERQIRDLLAEYGLDRNLPLFISEHDPYHYSEDKPEYHYQNAAGLVKTLYYSSLYSPNMIIMPWVLYHNGKIQTRFMWFEGPNRPDTKYEEIKILPVGMSMKLLSKLKGNEIQISNSVYEKDLVIGARDGDKILIEAVNYGFVKSVQLTLSNIGAVFKAQKVMITKFVVDKNNNNTLVQKTNTLVISSSGSNPVTLKGELELRHDSLETDGIVCWEITKIADR